MNKVVSGMYENCAISFMPKKTFAKPELFIMLKAFDKNSWLNLTPENIAEYEIIDQERRKNAGSAIVRGALGAAFLGPIGLLAGMSAKTKGTHTIAIRWKDDNKSLIVLDEKTYKEFLKLNF